MPIKSKRVHKADTTVITKAATKKRRKAGEGTKGTRQPSDFTVSSKRRARSQGQLIWRDWPLRHLVKNKDNYKKGRKIWTHCEECLEHQPLYKEKSTCNFEIDHIVSAGGFYMLPEYVAWITRLLVTDAKQLQRLCKACHATKTKREAGEKATSNKLQKEKKNTT